MGFIYSQLCVSLPYPEGSYKGKTVVVTGSNVGLGKEAARHFARLGAGTLVLAVRNLDKGHAAKQDIEATTKCGDKVIKVWKLDMSSYDSVIKFADKVDKELERVDIFIANAGIAPASYRRAEDNEESITINVVSTFLLAGLVLPKLKDTASRFRVRPTLTITSSEVHGFTSFPAGKSAPKGGILDLCSDEKFVKAHMGDQYNVSKLLEVFSVRAVADGHQPDPSNKFPVTVNCVNPGLCHSELGREQSSLVFTVMKKVLARTTEVGSRTLVHAGSSGVESHGQYMSDCSVAQPSKLVLSPQGKELQARVWEELCAKLDKIKPGVTKNFS